MFCDSCSEEIPDDSIFCPECGARQNLSRASFGAPTESLSGGVATSSGTGVVTPQAFNQSSSSSSQSSGLTDDLLSQISSKVISQDNDVMGGTPLSEITPTNNGPTIVPITSEMGTSPSASPTDELVERIMIAEKEIKEEQRNKWLQMNETASNVLSQVNSELPAHLRPTDQKASAASDFLKQTIGEDSKDEDLPDTSLLRRMTEVAVRRVARKRGVAVESPQSKLVYVSGDFLHPSLCQNQMGL